MGERGARADTAFADAAIMDHHRLGFLGSGAAARGEIVETATFAATAATLWWFADRRPRRDLR